MNRSLNSFLSPARVIVIDDKEEHMHAISKALAFQGISCIEKLYEPDDKNIDTQASAFGIRVIFLDANLTGTGSLNKKEDGRILLDEIKKVLGEYPGPYLLVLWTTYTKDILEDDDEIKDADTHPAPIEEIRSHLDEELKKENRSPDEILILSKKEFIPLEDNVEKLSEKITEKIQEKPAIAALMQWECAVQEAASRSVNHLYQMTQAGSGEQSDALELSKLLGAMGTAAFGKHAKGNKAEALYEAMLPVIRDNLAHIQPSQEDFPDKALNFKKSSPDPQTAAKLNTIFHIDTGARKTIIAPGTVWDAGLPGFPCIEGFTKANEGELHSEFFKKAKGSCSCWVLIAVQPACDYAQRKKGPVRFLLAAEWKWENGQERDSLVEENSQAMYQTPDFCHEAEQLCLVLNFRYLFTLPKAFINPLPLKYRLREQLLDEITLRLHVHGLRRGMVEFRGR